jgi:transketolase
MHTIKPIDRALVKTLAYSCKTIVTVEDHNVIGGLGSAVSEVLAENGDSKARLIRIGVENFGESGKTKELYDKYGLSAHRIVSRLKEIL